MKAYKIEVKSYDGAIIGVKMLTEEQYSTIKELFNDLNNNDCPTASFSVDGNDIEFGIKECPKEEFELTEDGVNYIGETLGC